MGVLSLCLVLLFGVLLGPSLAEYVECPIPGNPSSVSEAECIYSACQWINNQCQMKSNAEAGYTVAGPQVDTGRGFTVPLSKTDSQNTLFGADIQDLTLEVMYHEDYHLHFKIFDPNNARYEVPYKLSMGSQGTSPLYQVAVSAEGQPLSILVDRLSTSTTVFELEGPLTVEDQFLQFTIRLPSSYLYGLGENYHTSLRHSFTTRKTYPIFARDRGTGSPGEYNHYGSHPYCVSIENDNGDAHSVLFYNSNAIEYSTFLLDDGTPAITFRTIGGIIDLHLFFGPTPEDVNKQYISTIGKPRIPPYWSLGFTLSRYNYGSSSNYRVVWQRMKDEQIPLDVQTFDIDYMDGRRDFTYDPVNWADLPQLIDELHSSDIKVTLILDPAIAAEWDTYPPSSNGRDADAYVKWMSSDLIPTDQPVGANDFIVGRVWPDNRTVFPDFFNPNTSEWWKNECMTLHGTLDFDVIWIDMNEPSNFGTDTSAPDLICPDNYLDSPVYATKAVFNDMTSIKRISDATICMSSNHTDGTNTYLHYDAHSLYGLSETIATFNALEAIFPGQRHALLSRSTYVGSGHYAAHWLGDNVARWDQMELSIVGIIEFNMFGIAFVGADICGFQQASNMELCARWTELGAFYPYCRNHNDFNAPDQDPAVWPEVAAISRNILALRYQYLPYLYTLFHFADLDGSTVIRPLLNVFPTDLTARDVQNQFLWADAVMIAPVLVESATDRDVYFPQSYWYRLDTGELISLGGETLNIQAPLEYIPVYVRGGKILPFQYPGQTTTESRNNSFGLTVALSDVSDAAGELYWDDGITDLSAGESFSMSMAFQQDTLTTTINANPTEAAGYTLSTVLFYGISSNPTSVTVNGDGSTATWSFDVITQTLNVTGFSLPLNQPLTLVLA